MAASPPAAEPAVLTGRRWHPAAEIVPSLRVCTWNMLAQVYTRSSWFPWAPPAALKWKARSAALARDIADLRCDLLLLQEVDELPFWEAELARLGYEWRYKQRTQATGAKKDGCLVAWRPAVLRCVAAEEVEHNDLAAALAKPSEAWTRMSRDSVALLLCFEAVGSQRRLLAATTHIFWDPALEDVKNAQVSHLLKRLAAFREEHGGGLPFLVGGDFNSRPGSEAAARLFAGGGSLPSLLSVFAAVGADEPETTNHTASFSDTLDYLCLGGEGLGVSAALLLPSRAELVEGLPDALRPSDHLPLVADLQWR